MQDATPDTPSRILDAAEEAFADGGFAGARVNAIAEAAGANKAMLYYYFESKKGLYRAVLERAFTQILEVLSANIEQADQPDMAAFLDGYRKVLRSHPHLARLVMRDVIDGAPHVLEILGPKLPRLVAGVTTALEKGRQDGRYNPEILPMVGGPVFVAPFVMFAIAAPIIQSVTGISPELLAVPFDRTAEQILMRGLLARATDDGEGR